jgi:hypothetical protein
MPTIKGPIHIKGGDLGSAIEKEVAGKVKLPFEAAGWKSSKTPVLADTSKLK